MKKSCKKRKRKNSLKKILKGFTLVELLAVIVILAIIMVIAIPAVLNTMETARRKTFGEYVDKVSSLSQKQLAEDQMSGSKSFTECVVYNVKNGLGLNNTGSYEGWVLINPTKNDIYITLFDDNYVVIGYHYSDSSLKIDDYIEKKNTDNISKLTVEELCKSSSCTSCNVDGTSVAGKEVDTYVYNVSRKVMRKGEAPVSGINLRNTPEEAMADWQEQLGTGKTRPFYLKHLIKNNIITESYVEFVITPEMAATNSGMKAGTYTFRGANNDSQVYEANKATAIDAFGSANCPKYNSDPYTCSAGNYFAHINSNGQVIVDDNRNACVVMVSGGSQCEQYASDPDGD